MRVRTWRWNVDEYRWEGGARGEASATASALATQLMYVPREPLWYGADPVPPSTSSGRPISSFRVPRR